MLYEIYYLQEDIVYFVKEKPKIEANQLVATLTRQWMMHRGFYDRAQG